MKARDTLRRTMRLPSPSAPPRPKIPDALLAQTLWEENKRLEPGWATLRLMIG
jgi:hypothetical protein